MVLLYWRIESLAFGAVEIRGLNESGGVACFFCGIITLFIPIYGRDKNSMSR